ncbi:MULTISPECIES: helix-turn-helix domain-containing protein [unclassified Nocardioides]|uniref:arsenate reductase/protein-tyrosine-phosphatase family protein n=1 Tax=unclassified Nocardioides TaxID=2615069 RepID=UPI003619E680
MEMPMDVESRVRVLVALADPMRLRIVDCLHEGDASPSELGERLGISSNLLAHHLAVLEGSGLVSRHRSHADRRRTYLRLHGEALAELIPTDGTGAGGDVDRVVFVCTANSARSQLANALWRQASAIPSTSAGTHPAAAIAPGAVAVARRRGLRLVQDHPQGLADLLRDGDFVVTVCDGAHEELGSITRDASIARLTGIVHWSVPDPVEAGTDAAFDDAYDDLASRVAHLAPRLAAGPDGDHHADTSAAS